jgi:hypothetical protein
MSEPRSTDGLEGRWPVWIAVALALLLAASWLGFGFYAPDRDAPPAAGDAVETTAATRRDRVRVRVTEEMAPGGEGSRPSLADVARFHGLEPDSLPCSVRATRERDEEDLTDRRALQWAERPVRIGKEVTLCLD